MGNRILWAAILVGAAVGIGVGMGLTARQHRVTAYEARGGIMLKTSANTAVCVRRDILVDQAAP